MNARSTSQRVVAHPIPEDTTGKWRQLRALMNIRPPLPIRPDLLELQDPLLSAQGDAKGLTSLKPFRLSA
jgi:hypothetical protein